jgi:TatA/E family protein of Tat protein translocase
MIALLSSAADLTGCAMAAYIMPSWYEIMVVLTVGLLLFGRRLPEVGRSLGKTFTQFRRGLQDFKNEINADADLREAKGAVDDLRRTMQAPRRLADPRTVFDSLTDENLSSAGPPAGSDDPPKKAADSAEIPDS